MPCLEDEYSEVTQEVERVQEAAVSSVIQPLRSYTPVPVIEPSSSDTEPDFDHLEGEGKEEIAYSMTAQRIDLEACKTAIWNRNCQGLEEILYTFAGFDHDSLSQLEEVAIVADEIECLKVLIRYGSTPNSIAFNAGRFMSDIVREFIVQEYPDLPCLEELSFDGAISVGFIQWAKDNAPDHIQQCQNTVEEVAQRNDMELLQWLVDRYGTDQIDPEMILISAASHGRLNMARYAVGLGARAFGRGAYYALASTAPHVANYLLTLSPDVKYSAAYIAREHNMGWIVEYVLPNGIDLYIS